MACFQSKRIEIEAWQVPPTGFNPAIENVPDWVLSSVSSDGVLGMQGRVEFNPGDWLIREMNGHGAYPCNPTVFDAKYEAF